MEVEVLETAEEAARRAAIRIAGAARLALDARRQFLVAFSGGRSPAAMLRDFAGFELDWSAVEVFQVDERVAPAGDAARNLTGLADNLAGRVPLPAGNLHPMPVEGTDLPAAAAAYADELRKTAGTPPVLDLVHLGLGADGHTASLVPGDAALDVHDRDVAVAGPYQGRERLTLTYPVLARARQLLFLVTGADKQQAVQQLIAGDTSIPAGRLPLDSAILIADRAALPER